jgi:chemotaxis protein MotB
MSRRKRSAGHTSHERWLVSYADFITLLFAFFVVMFSSARIDKEKTVQLAQAIQTAFQQLGTGAAAGGWASSAPHKGEEPTAKLLGRAPAAQIGPRDTNRNLDDFAEIQKELEKLLAPEIKRREVALRTGPDGLIISLREIGFFNSGSAQIKPQAIAAVHRVADFLRSRDCALRIEGHTDNVPIHTSLFASNWELSTARATTLVKLLVESDGFAADRLSAAGYAEFHPVADNSTPAGQQLNRRVDIVVVPIEIPLTQMAMTGKAPPSSDQSSPAKSMGGPVKN